MPQILSAYVERRCLPLKQPFVNSLGTLDAFDSLLLYMTLDNGETRIGEVVPLAGYSSESPEDVLHSAESWLPHLIGHKIENARQSDYPLPHQIMIPPRGSSGKIRFAIHT